ncbi:hypothetical protein [Tolypothrix sp. NIES-4075]|uniref:hypothetical protein n=1 Tax=Tolypothrix sp. NIES-4075 TaxID=2005459 RepID=UPI00135BE972|nr:hypothetical protein [Tolypothrix sp. NIES-4075]
MYRNKGGNGEVVRSLCLLIQQHLECVIIQIFLRSLDKDAQSVTYDGDVGILN